MIGQTLAHYRIEAQLGAGGMGVVYRALDTRLGRAVALKVLPAEKQADETARARLLREARAASSLNHPHICTIYEVGEADGQTYIAMELVEGQPLSARVPAEGLPVEAVLRYGAQMADGETAGAIRELDKVLKQDPQYLWALAFLAQTYLDRGELRQARQALERARPGDRQNFWIRIHWSLLLAWEGKPVEARKEMDTEVLKYAAGSPWAAAEAAEIYAVLGE